MRPSLRGIQFRLQPFSQHWTAGIRTRARNRARRQRTSFYQGQAQARRFDAAKKGVWTDALETQLEKLVTPSERQAVMAQLSLWAKYSIVGGAGFAVGSNMQKTKQFGGASIVLSKNPVWANLVSKMASHGLLSSLFWASPRHHK